MVKDAPLDPGQERDVGAADAEGAVVLAAWLALVIEVVEGLALVDVDLVEVDLGLRDLARTSAPMLRAGILGLALRGGAVSF